MIYQPSPQLETRPQISSILVLGDTQPPTPSEIRAFMDLVTRISARIQDEGEGHVEVAV